MFAPRATRALSTLAASPRFFSSASDAANLFTGEAANLYKLASENHRHPNGPWNTIPDQVHLYAKSLGTTELRVLDLATGPGEPAETIARRFPDSTVVATDVSPDQVALATEKVATLPHMTVHVADMQDLSAFEPSFDVVTCCYGFMFPSDIPLAISESYRVLKPGGRLIATTWNKMSVMPKLRSILTEVLGKEPPPPPMNPLSLAEAGLFERLVEEAGYNNVECTSYSYPFDFTKDPEVQFQLSVLPARDKLEEWNAWEKAREAFEKVKNDFGAYHDNGHWILSDNEYKLTVATKPFQ